MTGSDQPTNDILGRPHVAAPMVYDFCGIPLYHGERDDSEACFCGAPEYFLCERYLAGEGDIGRMTIYRSDDDGAVHVHDPGPRS